MECSSLAEDGTAAKDERMKEKTSVGRDQMLRERERGSRRMLGDAGPWIDVKPTGAWGRYIKREYPVPKTRDP